MRRLRGLFFRLVGMFDRARSEREFAEELESHLEMHVEDNLRAGMSAEEARRVALVKLGGVEATKERYRDRRSLPALETLLQDIRFGLRILSKNRAFTCVVLVSLSLGIGATTAIFSVVNAVLLRPLPFESPERLVSVWETNLTRGSSGPSASPPDFREWRDRTRGFRQLAAFYARYFNLSGEGEPERVQGSAVSANFFSTLGVSLTTGRAFLPEEEQYGSHRVVVLSDSLWRRRFGADPTVVGQAIRLNNQEYLVAGVAPPDFRFPDERTQVWTPMAFAPDDRLNTRGNHFLGVIGRLEPGVGLEEAQTELDVVTATLAEEHPENAGVRASILPLKEEVVGTYRPALLMLSGAVGLVLLITCANVANLLLARAASRQNEFVLRASLGASRPRIVRQLLTESLLLSTAGGAVGLLLAVWGVRALVALGPADLPRASEIGVDGWVLAFTLTLCVLTGVIFGLAPVLHSFQPEPGGALKESGRTATGSVRARSMRNVLVASEIALCLVLTIGAGLLITSFRHLHHVDVGFDPGNVLTLHIPLPESKYPDSKPERARAFYRELLERVAALPGVRAAGASSGLPLAKGGWGKLVTIEGRPAPASLDAVPVVQYRQASPDYFRALGARLVAGRFFTERDDENSPTVAVVTEEMARRFWPGEDPLGKGLYMGPPETMLPEGALPAGYSFPRLTVVGVVGDIKSRGLHHAAGPEVFIPHLQGATETQRTMFLAVRATTDPTALVAAVRSQVAAIDEDQPVADLQTMEQRLAASLTPARFNVALVGVFALVALLLAAVGLYGVIAYSVAQRAREFAVRMAVGARPGDVLMLVVGQGMRITVLGIGAGSLAALALTRTLSSMLFGVSPTDPVTFAAVAALLAGVALAACIVPALRAMKVDPAIVLRNE